MVAPPRPAPVNLLLYRLRVAWRVRHEAMIARDRTYEALNRAGRELLGLRRGMPARPTFETVAAMEDLVSALNDAALEAQAEVRRCLGILRPKWRPWEMDE